MSLQRIGSGWVEHEGFWFFARHRFHVSRTRFFELTHGQYRRAAAQLESVGAAEIARDGDRLLWWTPAGLHWSDGSLSAEDVDLLLWDRQRRQDARLTRLRDIRAREVQLEGSRRSRIPADVRAFVWERDDGRCVSCGVDDDLQFDHVIPVSRGGANSVENIQVLCGDCNRMKSDKVE